MGTCTGSWQLSMRHGRNDKGQQKKAQNTTVPMPSRLRVSHLQHPPSPGSTMYPRSTSPGSGALKGRAMRSPGMGVGESWPGVITVTRSIAIAGAAFPTACCCLSQ